MAQFYRSFVKDNLIVILGHVLIYLKGIFLIPLIVKTVGVSVYGGFMLLSSYLGFFYGLSSWGAGIKAMRFLPSAQGRLGRQSLFYPQFYFQLISLTIISLLLIVLDPVVQPLLFKGEVQYSVYLVPFYLLTYFLYSQGADYFRYTSRVQGMILVTMIFPYLHLALVGLYFSCFHVLEINQIVGLHCLAALTVALPCLVIIAKELRVCFIFFRPGELKESICLGFPLVINFVVDFILSGIDRYFIAFYLSVTAVGYYSPAYSLGALAAFVPKAMGTALPQLLSRAVDRGQSGEAQRMLDYALKIFLLLAIPFVLGSVVMGGQVLSVLANREVACHARWVVPLVALGTVFYGLNMLLMNVFFVRLETGLILKLNVLAALFNILSNWILLYCFPYIIVAAATTLGSYCLVFILLQRLVAQRWQVGWPWPVLLKSVLSSLLMAASLWAVTREGVWSPSGHWGADVLSLGLDLLLGLVVYTLGLFALKAFTAQEMAFVRRIVFARD